MKTVIYKINSYNVVRVVSGSVSFSDLQSDEDFMPLSLWNKGASLLGYPVIN